MRKSWYDWYEPRKERVVLDKEKDIWVEILDPADLPWGEQKKLARLGASLREGKTDEADMDKMEEALACMIVGWNLKDGKGRDIPPPAEDRKSLELLPTRWFLQIQSTIVDLLARMVPGEVKEPSSGQP